MKLGIRFYGNIGRKMGMYSVLCLKENDFLCMDDKAILKNIIRKIQVTFESKSTIFQYV